MRRFWTSTNRDELAYFADLLNSHGIATTIDAAKEADWENEAYGTPSFSLWVNDDNDILKAKELFSTFSPQTVTSTPKQAEESGLCVVQSSRDSTIENGPIFDRSNPEALDTPKSRSFGSSGYTQKLPPMPGTTPLAHFVNRSFHIHEKAKATTSPTFPIVTFSLVVICLLCFILSGVALSYFLFDSAFLAATPATPYWGGLLSLIETTHADTSLSMSVFFAPILSGQVWRLFTPILLHANLVHLVLNMMWFIPLGRMIESRLHAWRFLLLIAIIAGISNTAQYIVSGPAFLGISGVICGLAGFISSRQRTAPWEAYPLPPQMYQFLLFSVGLLVALSVVMFVLSFRGFQFPISFGNTAHVSGLFAGRLLGRMAFFSTTKRTTVIKFS